MIQSGERFKNTFFSVTLCNFQRSGSAIALPAAPPPRSLLSGEESLEVKLTYLIPRAPTLENLQVLLMPAAVHCLVLYTNRSILSIFICLFVQ